MARLFCLAHPIAICCLVWVVLSTCSNLSTSSSTKVQSWVAPVNGPLFRSGFEEGVRLKGNDRSDIEGQDAEGQNWVTDLEAVPYIKFFDLNFVDGMLGPHYFVDLIQDPENADNRVLYWENRRDGSQRSTSRTQCELHFQQEGALFEEGYIEYKIRFSNNLNHLKEYSKAINWFSLMEFWEYPDPNLDGDRAGKSRVTLSLNKAEGAGEDLFWRLTAEKMQPARLKHDKLWDHYNMDIEVPIGSWFSLRTYFRYGGPDTGRVWISVILPDKAEQTLFDVNDIVHHTSNPLPLRSWQFLKLYTSPEVLDFMSNAKKPVAAFYDDIEIWHRLPERVEQAPSQFE